MQNNKTIQIGNLSIGANHPPFVVAEMSGNHNQSLDRALQIVEAAAASGASAVKLQTYTADTMTIESKEGSFFISDEKSLWKGESLYNLYQQAYTPWEWHEKIFQRCQELGILCFSTPFDATAVDFLEFLNVPAYKIASFENIDLPLIKKVAQTKKPVIISTGMANVSEIEECVEAARSAGCEDLILLKCTSAYPASPEQCNLRTIPHMSEMFQVPVGLSDHTMGTGVSIAAVAMGAVFLEKHFTLARSDGGVDSAFSLEPQELKELVSATKMAWQALGSVSYTLSETEKKSLQFRRSLYVVSDVEAGEALTEKNLRAIRPGEGLAPKYYDFFLGKKAKQAIRKGTPLSWDLV